MEEKNVDIGNFDAKRMKVRVSSLLPPFTQWRRRTLTLKTLIKKKRKKDCSPARRMSLSKQTNLLVKG